jgi:hypothetical protein
MPDLSKVLGDVYGSAEPAAAPLDVPVDDHADHDDLHSARANVAEPATLDRAEYMNGGSAPAWADDDRLDQVFSAWTPGPAADAPAAERKLFPKTSPLDDDLATALSEALAVADRMPEDEALPPVAITVEAPVDRLPDPGPALDDLPYFADEPAAPAVAAPLAEVEPSSAAWQRSDDDILPRGGKAGRSLKLRAGKAQGPEAAQRRRPGPQAPAPPQVTTRPPPRSGSERVGTGFARYCSYL